MSKRRSYTNDFPLSRAGLLERHFLAFDAPLRRRPIHPMANRQGLSYVVSNGRSRKLVSVLWGAAREPPFKIGKFRAASNLLLVENRNVVRGTAFGGL